MMRKIFGKSVSFTVLASAMLLGAPALALAQETAAKPAGGTTNQGDIVVTAQFREERLQDTPIAISAITAETLESRSVTDIAAAANAAPNVNIAKGAAGFGQTAAVFIRGIGQADPHFAVEPGVGMYLDDVYYGVMTGSVFSLLDVDRVEVLRGPQGTLAGKNSIGGSVKLFSKRPGPETDGYAEMTYGGRDLIGGRAAANLTIVPDTLFARISVAGRRSDGYVDRLDYNCVTGSTTIDTFRLTPNSCKLGTEGGEEVLTARAAFRWLVNDQIENTIIFDSVEDNSENPASKLLAQSPLWAGTENYVTCPTCYTNYENNISIPTGPGAGPPFAMPANSPLTGSGVTNLFSWDISDNLKLESITGFRKSTVTFSTQGGSVPFSINDQLWRLAHKQFTQELRLSGQAGDLLDWTVGAFYYDADGASTLRVNLPGGFVVGGGGVNLDLLGNDPVQTSSKSVFAHSVWHLTDKLGVTAAIRYTEDEKTFTFNRLDRFGNPHPALPGLVNYPVTYSGSRTDYRLGADYQWTDDFMTYAQVSTGYKGGGVSARPYFPSQALPYDPETLTAYEAGFKSQFFDRRLTLNGAAFYNKYKDFQGLIFSCPAFTPGNATAPCAMTTNIGDATIKGLELEAVLEPVDNLRFDASVGWLDFAFDDVIPTSGVQLDWENIYTPDLNFSVGAQYQFGIGSLGTITPRLDYTYHSSFFTSTLNSDPLNEIDSQGLLNGRISWKDSDDTWEAAFAVTNIADEFYYASKFASTTAPYFDGTGRPGEPRQWTITIKRKFD